MDYSSQEFLKYTETVLTQDPSFVEDLKLKISEENFHISRFIFEQTAQLSNINAEYPSLLMYDILDKLIPSKLPEVKKETSKQITFEFSSMKEKYLSKLIFEIGNVSFNMANYFVGAMERHQDQGLCFAVYDLLHRQKIRNDLRDYALQDLKFLKYGLTNYNLSGN